MSKPESLDEFAALKYSIAIKSVEKRRPLLQFLQKSSSTSDRATLYRPINRAISP